VAAPQSPFFGALQEHCLAMPGAWEDYPWGETVFKVGKKMFANCHAPETGGLSVMLKATRDDQAALVQLPGITKAAYVGQHGWITALITDDAGFNLVKDLATASYNLVARPPKKAQAQK
jgi:predicted DNA-binding protein (MmcQ/YjbR family)